MLQTGVQLDASYRALSQHRHQEANTRTRTAQQVNPQDILNAQRAARLREPASMKSAIKRNVSACASSLCQSCYNLVFCVCDAVHGCSCIVKGKASCACCMMSYVSSLLCLGIMQVDCAVTDLVMCRLMHVTLEPIKSNWTQINWSDFCSSCLNKR